MRMLSIGMGTSKMPADCRWAIYDLDDKGLADARYDDNDDVVDARLSIYGHRYLACNPHLRNPFDWQWVSICANIVAIVCLTRLICKLLAA